MESAPSLFPLSDLLSLKYNNSSYLLWLPKELIIELHSFYNSKDKYIVHIHDFTPLGWCIQILNTPPSIFIHVYLSCISVISNDIMYHGLDAVDLFFSNPNSGLQLYYDYKPNYITYSDGKIMFCKDDRSIEYSTEFMKAVYQVASKCHHKDPDSLTQ